jgi:hypothetical protein
MASFANHAEVLHLKAGCGQFFAADSAADGSAKTAIIESIVFILTPFEPSRHLANRGEHAQVGVSARSPLRSF